VLIIQNNCREYVIELFMPIIDEAMAENFVPSSIILTII
jgi:hypothetical protein